MVSSNATDVEERGFRRRWPWIVGLGLLVVLVALLLIVRWNGWQLGGIPDVGEPFDVKKFSAFALPDEQNAFTFYRNAQASYVASAAVGTGANSAQDVWQSAEKVLENGWATANSDVRHWLEVNRTALELWKRGSEQSEAYEIRPANLDMQSLLPVTQVSREFVRLLLLQGARFTAEGHPRESWECYGEALRTSRHMGMHASFVGRLVGAAEQAMCVEPILRWSARPELSAADLRKALADTLAIDAMTLPFSDTFECEYLIAQKSVQNNVGLGPGLDGMFMKLTGLPEKTRRSLNLCYANWLNAIDRPRFQRPIRDTRFPFFELDPNAPRDSKLLPPTEIARICGFTGTSAPGSNPLVTLILPAIVGAVDAVDREQVRRSALIVGLALELYHREHGQFPQGLEELVAKGYLKSIPADPFGKGEPIHYRRGAQPTDEALLWSVWIDGVDQQGHVEAPDNTGKSSGDKRFRILAPMAKPAH